MLPLIVTSLSSAKARVVVNVIPSTAKPATLTITLHTDLFKLPPLPVLTGSNGEPTIPQVHYSHNDVAVYARFCFWLGGGFRSIVGGSRAQPHLRNIVRIITETGLRVYKELMSMKKDQVDLLNAVVWIPESKTPNGVAEVPLTPIAVEAFRDQLALAGQGEYLFPSDLNPA